jgi:hypothetical protein
VTWAALHPLLLTLGTVILRRHVECQLPESFAAPACPQSALRDTPTVQGSRRADPAHGHKPRFCRWPRRQWHDERRWRRLACSTSPRKGPGELSVADLTMLVRVPGQPTAVRGYSDDERVEAARYAAEVGGVVVPLALSPPTGYRPGPDGTLIPTVVATEDRR